MYETFKAYRDGKVTAEMRFRKLRDREEALLVAALSGAKDRKDIERRAEVLMGMPDLLLAVSAKGNSQLAMVTHKDTYTAPEGEESVSVAWEVFEPHRRIGIGSAVASAALARHFGNAKAEATVSVDPGDAVGIAHLEKLGFAMRDADPTPASLRGDPPVNMVITYDGFERVMRDRLWNLPTPERDERCAISGLPIQAGAAVAMAIVKQSRRPEPDDLDWAPGSAPDEGILGDVFEAEYDGRGWVSWTCPGAGRDAAEEALRAALSRRGLPEWTRPDSTSAVRFLGALMREAEAGGPAQHVGAIMVRKDALDMFSPMEDRDLTPQEETARFVGALRSVGVPLAPTVRCGRPGMDPEALARLREVVREVVRDFAADDWNLRP